VDYGLRGFLAGTSYTFILALSSSTALPSVNVDGNDVKEMNEITSYTLFLSFSIMTSGGFLCLAFTSKGKPHLHLFSFFLFLASYIITICSGKFDPYND